MKKKKRDEAREREMKEETYEGVYMMYLRGGKMEKSHLGISSKLQ